MKENKQVVPAVSSCTTEDAQKDGSAKISRSPGIAVHNYIVGGGWRGFSSELDIIVMQEAEFLRDHYGVNVTIRYNSDRMSGGAWLIDSEEDNIGSNSSIGLGARLVSSRLRAMSLEDKMRLSAEEYRRLCREADTIIFSTHIDLKKSEHCVPLDSKHILLDSEYRDFTALDEAITYLKAHAFGLKQEMIRGEQT